MDKLDQIKRNYDELVRRAKEDEGSYEADEMYFNAEALKWVISLLENNTTDDFVVFENA